MIMKGSISKWNKGV